VIDRLAGLPVPVVVAVHGYCFTGALELALAADLILASGNARFADTHARFGLSPRWGMSQRLPRRVGLAKAKEMMFTTRQYDAQAALAMGLADQCFEDGEFAGKVAGYVGEILAGSWFSHFHNKRVLAQTDGWELARGLAHERDTHPGVDPAARERLAAFGKKV
jgi:enoyl-CoA hydratase/carnithine racemase